MNGLIALAIAALLAAAFIVTGLRKGRAEDRMLQRLVPVKARILDPGTTRRTDISIAGHDTPGHSHKEPGTPIVEHSYRTTWEYEVDGRRYEGAATQGSPLFSGDEARFRRTTVFYDRDNPAVSRMHKLSAAPGKPFVIFGALILFVGVAICLVANIDAMTAQQAARQGR